MQLANDDALGSIDDERAVVGHQRDVAEEDFLLLDVANGARFRLRVFLVDGQAHRDLERGRVGHATLLALAHVILQLQSYRIATLVAEVRRVRVIGSALGAQHVAGVERVGNNGRTAILASSTQMMKSLEVTAFAFPVTNRVVDELQLRDIAEVADGKDRLKDCLQPGIIALTGQAIHLQKSFIGALLHFNQIRNLDGGWNS